VQRSGVRCKRQVLGRLVRIFLVSRGCRNGGQEGFKVRDQRAQRLTVRRRDSDCVIPLAEDAGFVCREAVTLVQDHHAGNRVQVERLQDGFDGGDLLIDVGGRRIDHMQE
jgi:hypothetical protein